MNRRDKYDHANKSQGNGTVVSRSQLDSITVQIVSGKVRIPDDPTQPLEYNDEWNVHPEITAGTEGATKI
jgi:tyrosinase